jgi:hypothetical protein
MPARRMCSRCNKLYNEYPAISRRDNKTEICSKCGTEEALIDFARFQRRKKQFGGVF